MFSVADLFLPGTGALGCFNPPHESELVAAPFSNMERSLQECEYFIKFNLVVSADRGANIRFTLSAF